MAKHEISLMKQINSPQIIKLEDHFKREEVFYMIMEYCSRGDLEKVLKGRSSIIFIQRDYQKN
jgi:serine/threonine protein kinase